MHATLAELLENFKSGLLWVQKDGVVRYANADAMASTGLAPGRKLYDPDLVRAVAQVVSSQSVGQVTAAAAIGPAARSPGELRCRILPGLSRDDAFVLVANDHSEQGAAFDNLLAVVRTDLRDPLREAQAGLQALGEQGVQVAAQASAVLEVLDKLVDLADLWASDALLESDRIEPWPLLQQVWLEVAPLAKHRSITVRLDAHQKAAGDLAAIYGSETWLRRVFRECLAQAVNAARPGDTLDIDYRQLGPRALVVFRDCGAFAGASAGAVELKASRETPPVRAAASAQIGFKLCQHIVSLHGGRLREEMEDGMRNFLIDLPTGAPHRSDGAQLDIAQAQQYARDLAALMARARRRAA
jgi:signal transduction histidine kinase